MPGSRLSVISTFVLAPVPVAQRVSADWRRAPLDGWMFTRVHVRNWKTNRAGGALLTEKRDVAGRGTPCDGRMVYRLRMMVAAWLQAMDVPADSRAQERERRLRSYEAAAAVAAPVHGWTVCERRQGPRVARRPTTAPDTPKRREKQGTPRTRNRVPTRKRTDVYWIARDGQGAEVFRARKASTLGHALHKGKAMPLPDGWTVSVAPAVGLGVRESIDRNLARVMAAIEVKTDLDRVHWLQVRALRDWIKALPRRKA